MSNLELAELIADVKEQVLYLQELGVEALAVEISSEFKVQGSKSNAETPSPALISIKDKPQQRGSRIASLPSLSSRVKNASTDFKEIHNPQSTIQNEAVPPVPGVSPFRNGTDELLLMAAPTRHETSDTIESIRSDIGDCTRCKLHSLGRKQIVHTTGNFQADLMFVGEAPGADEDEKGFPFVGRAGQLLTDIIVAMGFRREDVCIGNINRCRPPGNRQPEPDETAQCRPFILREIAVVKPKVIVVLGATAAHNLLQVKTPISKLRGNFQDYFGVKVMPTFHPAYLLRDPHKKREVWDDMKMVRDYLSKDEG